MEKKLELEKIKIEEINKAKDRINIYENAIKYQDKIDVKIFIELLASIIEDYTNYPQFQNKYLEISIKIDNNSSMKH